MEELEELALEAIRQQPGLRCGGIGDRLFKHISYMKGSAPYARLAGKVMKRLEARGLAYYDSKGFGGWRPTARASKKESQEN